MEGPAGDFVEGPVGAPTGAGVVGVGNGSTPVEVGDEVKENGGKEGKKGANEEPGVLVGEGVTVGNGVVVGDGVIVGDGEVVGVITPPPETPVMNRLTSSSIQGIPPGTSAATTAVVSILASKQTSIVVSSRMTMMSPGPNGFAAIASRVKSAGSSFRTLINPRMSMTSTVFKLVTW